MPLQIMASTTQEKDKLNGQFEAITSTTRIANLLQPLLQKRSILNVSLSGKNEKFSTALLQINSDNSFILLDELVPRHGNNVVTPSTDLFISAQISGIDLNFKSKIIEVGSNKGVALYKVAFPDTLNYHQRRKAFRAPVGPAHSYAITIKVPTGQHYEGELHDISVTGMCVRFPQKTILPDKWPKQTTCEIHLPTGKTLNAQFRVCHIAKDGSGKCIYLGGLFLQLDKSQQRTIEKFVIELQRKARQRMIR
jgi:c-di-GMP-binding flagellar brake protein YcgR